MKKIFTLFIALLLLASCATHRNARIAKINIRGDWTLNSVTYDNPGLYKINLLNDAQKACFENSLWHFVVNNASGTYEFANSDCAKEKRYFFFTVEEKGKESKNLYILIKPTDEKRNSKNNKGYRFHLSQIADNTMQWTKDINLDGQIFKLHLNFKRKK